MGNGELESFSGNKGIDKIHKITVMDCYSLDMSRHQEQQSESSRIIVYYVNFVTAWTLNLESVLTFRSEELLKEVNR